MSKFVPLDNIIHADLRVKIQYNELTGDNLNQALVFPTEFNELQREYPIVFRRSEAGEFRAVVLLGLDREENLFLEDGHWKARHIPAIRSRGPFNLALHEDDNEMSQRSDPVVQIDMEHPNLSNEEGVGIFLSEGGHSAFLTQTLNALRKLQVGTQVEASFFAELEKFDLIEDITLEANLNDREKYTIPDVYTISRQRIASLSAEDIHHLNQSGLLEHCFSVMSSLGNMSRLVDMKVSQKTTSVS